MSPLDTNDAFTYLWYIWRFVGIHPFGKLSWLYTIYGFIVNLIGSVLSPVFIFMNVFFLGDIGSILHNLQLSLTLIVSSVKQFVIFLRLSDLQGVKQCLVALDKRASSNEDELEYMKNVIAQCRLMVKAIQVAFLSSLLSYAIPGLFKGQLILDGWFPLDWKSSRIYYLIAFSVQFFQFFFQIVQNAGSDAYPPVYINVLKGHIHVLCMRVERIGKDPSSTREENYIELKACVNDHKNVIRLFESIKPVISQTVMIQFTVTGFILCITVVNFVIIDREFGQLITTIIYVVAILLQAFPVCYYGNELMWQTDVLTNAIYNCNWVDQSVKFRKCVIIFMQRSQKTNVILAGGLAAVSLQTFVAIIRFSFSMFTVLSQL